MSQAETGDQHDVQRDTGVRRDVEGEWQGPRTAPTTAVPATAPTGGPTAAGPTAAGPLLSGAPAGSRLGRLGLGLFRSELLTTFRRWRTLALLGVLALVPVMVGIAVKIETSDGGAVGDGGGEGPAFIAQVTNNGLFLVFTSLAVTLPFFLPMTVGVIAGDSLAGEAASGTLRYLLVAPAGRTRLLLVKYATTFVFCLAATLVVALSALIVGSLLFPLGEVTLLSGTTVSFGEGLGRALVIAVLVALSLLGLAALGVFISTLTNSGVTAMAATVGLLITVQILDTIPQLHAVPPFLFPHYWLSFGDVLRDPVYWDQLVKNLGLQALYAAFFGSAAWARLTTKDITA
ncbi:ABC transporter permease [Streptomyces sp. Z26]|uniref:ABC transporter permease n=1 Tax=Streptomyces sp. Z26 TaxID=2500177 RepID=UPI001F0C95A4|nr:ABC transporter permease [Streptomyces sp. Z26]